MEFLNACRKGKLRKVRSLFLKDPQVVERAAAVTGTNPMAVAAHEDFLEVLIFLFRSYWQSLSELRSVVCSFLDEPAKSKCSQHCLEFLGNANSVLDQFPSSLTAMNNPILLCLFDRSDELFQFLSENDIKPDENEKLIDICCKFYSDDSLRILFEPITEKKMAMARPSMKEPKQMVESVGAEKRKRGRPRKQPGLGVFSAADVDGVPDHLNYRSLSPNAFIKEEGKSILQHFCVEKSMVAVKYLIKNGANLGFKDLFGFTALHFACESGTTDVVRILLEKGANPNDQDDRGDSPLHISVRLELKKITILLLAYGADILLSNLQKQTPKDCATTPQMRAILSVDNQKDPWGLSQLRKTIDLAQAKKMVEEGKVLDSLDSNGNTMVHVCAYDSSLEILLFLLENCRIEPLLGCKNDSSLTPLHFAIRNKQPRATTLLIKAGANYTFSDSAEKDPIRQIDDANFIESLLAEPSLPTLFLDLLKTRLTVLQQAEQDLSGLGEIFEIRFSGSSLSFVLRKQTNRILKKMGGLRKSSYRSLPFLIANDDQTSLLQNSELISNFLGGDLSRADNQRLELIEACHFYKFLESSYGNFNRLSITNIFISSTNENDLSSSLPPKMARKYKDLS